MFAPNTPVRLAVTESGAMLTQEGGLLHGMLVQKLTTTKDGLATYQAAVPAPVIPEFDAAVTAKVRAALGVPAGQPLPLDTVTVETRRRTG